MYLDSKDNAIRIEFTFHIFIGLSVELEVELVGCKQCGLVRKRVDYFCNSLVDHHFLYGTIDNI